jgi:hypothetical protein
VAPGGAFARSILAGIAMGGVLAASLGAILGVLFRDLRLAITAGGLVFFAGLYLVSAVAVENALQEWTRTLGEDE